jgi:hypothetical protein
MICPNKLCGEEIPDDSLYCDQCGTQILRCSRCGTPGTGKFCGKCGGAMTFTPPPTPPARGGEKELNQTAVGIKSSSSPPAGQNPSSGAGVWTLPGVVGRGVSSPSSSATVAIQLPSDHIEFCHPDGWKLEIKSGDILGRTHGQHTEQLGKIPVISGNHAQVTARSGKWFLTDLKSTNHSYVNGMRLEPGVPTQIKQNDVVTLANVNFTVVEV